MILSLNNDFLFNNLSDISVHVLVIGWTIAETFKASYALAKQRL